MGWRGYANEGIRPKTSAGSSAWKQAGVSSSGDLRHLLLAGMSTHAATILQHGLFWNYGGGVPRFTRVFWTSLTFLDPLAAILLFLYPRIGVVATFAIISVHTAG